MQKMEETDCCGKVSEKPDSREAIFAAIPGFSGAIFKTRQERTKSCFSNELAPQNFQSLAGPRVKPLTEA
jgi:hypothetical protein